LGLNTYGIIRESPCPVVSVWGYRLPPQHSLRGMVRAPSSPKAVPRVAASAPVATWISAFKPL